MANVSKLRLNGISYDIKDNDARKQLALIQNQFNQLIAPSGEAPNPAQIQNARIGVDGVVYDTLGNAIRTQINNLNSIIINNGGGLSTDAKMALLTCFQKVAWIDDQGQIYYNALYNSLFPTAISISATFNSASHIFYDTDTLNDLRPYLTVKATLPDSTIEIITNYSLRGSMTVGTNIITVQYQGLTDTFSVTVEADPSYITAVFTQPQTTIYTDDALNTLKSNLVVTLFRRPGEAGTVLADSAYTLSGTLTEGTSTITAEYQGLTDTFNVANVVDFYNITSWAYPSNGLLLQVGTAQIYDLDDAKVPSIALNNPNRRAPYVSHGKIPFRNYFTGELIDGVYPIPVPDRAKSVTATVTPSTSYINIRPYRYDETSGYNARDGETGWKQASATFSKLSPGIKYFIGINIKYDSAGTSYPTDPTNVNIEFAF